MSSLERLLRSVLPSAVVAALALTGLRVAAEPAVLFDAKGLSRDWTAQSWGGLEIGTKRGGNDQLSYSVKLKESTQPFAGFNFKSVRGRAFPLDANWREKGLVVVRIRLGTDFYGTPLKSLDLKLGLTLLLSDGRSKSSPNKLIPIRASVDGGDNPVVIVAPFSELIDPALAAASPVAVTELTLQHLEAPAGNFEIVECAFVLEQN